MPRMARNDSKNSSNPLDLDLSDALKSEVKETPAEETAPASESSVPSPAPEAEPEKRPDVELQFDPEYAVDDRVSEVVVNVAASSVTLPVDGTPVSVSADDADLLVQNPAVKVVA
jgi:hypothetical protein